MQAVVDVQWTSMEAPAHQTLAPVPPESSWIDWVNRSGTDIPDDPVDAAEAILEAIERRWWFNKYIVPHMRDYVSNGYSRQDELIRHWMAGGSIKPRALMKLFGCTYGEAKSMTTNMPVGLDAARRDWVLDLMIDNPDATPAEISAMCEEFVPAPKRDTIYAWRDRTRSDYRVSQLDRRMTERGLL